MIYFLAPAYNEEKNLPKLAAQIKKSIVKNFKIVIVDDGSTDQTFEIEKRLSQKYPLIALGYRNNRGPGYAFKTGIEYVLKKCKKNDVLVTIEADNTSDLSAVKKMFTLLKSFDVVIASPFEKGGQFIGVSTRRIFLSWGYQKFLSIIFNVKGASSYGNFFRAYKTESLKRARGRFGRQLITEQGFSSAAELLIKMDKIDAKIVSIPVKIDWTKRQGKSKMKVFKYIKRQGVFILKYKFLSAYFLK